MRRIFKMLAVFRAQRWFFLAALLAVVAATAPTGCASGADKWHGSVDAVLKYRSGDSSTIVYEVAEGTFSAEAGLAVGDVLLAIDGVEVASAPFGKIKAAIRGPVGTVAMLKVKRGDAIVELEVERRPISSEKSGS